ncbi:rhodanese-like protein [delta proteobacterium NaphS2]|nr:rhodanese-like protein [delta proteobacterium NaphS2]
MVFNHSNPNGIPLFQKIALNDKIGIMAPEAAEREMKYGDPQFVDARPSDFYKEEHIPGSINIPLPVFDIMYMAGLSDTDKSREIIVYGRTVSRLYDVYLANKLFLRGHKNVRILKGGLPEWRKRGYPVSP